MNNEQFDELAGRIQALADFLLCLTAELEDRKLIDGPRFSAGLRRFAGHRNLKAAHLPATRRTLLELVGFLDAARGNRQ